MPASFYQRLSTQLMAARTDGLFKEERIITTAQRADIEVTDGGTLLNSCANDYLGLADHPTLIAATKAGLDSHGFGMARGCAKRAAIAMTITTCSNWKHSCKRQKRKALAR